MTSRITTPFGFSSTAAEVIAAAKLIHWTGNHPDARLLQVQHMINTARGLVKEGDNRLGLDGLAAAPYCAPPKFTAEPRKLRNLNENLHPSVRKFCT